MMLPHNHDYIERCPHCSRFMTAAQAKNHVCDSSLIDIKEIEILFHYDTQNEYGDTIVMARGLDGVLYRLRQRKNHPTKVNMDTDSDDKLPEPLQKSLLSSVRLFLVCD